MDFRRVLDQAIREIKREVNLKVLKVPEIEQKVLDATSDEPWGPHGSALAEIARETRKFSDCQLIMNALWSRLSETDQNWRHVYKALSVIEYLIANGSERALSDIVDHSIQISSLSGFEHVESNGKDAGINVRKKVETILALLDDRERITSVRNKAAATHDKYSGLSSSGITYKSSLSSFNSSGSRQYDGYGGTNNIRDNPKTKDVYKQSDEKANRASKSVADRKDGVGHHGRSSSSASSNASKASSKRQLDTSKPVVTESVVNDDLDDFNPRASTAGSHKVDPFADSLLIDWSDPPASIPTATTCGSASPAVIDLFANSNKAFLSSAGAQVIYHPEEKVDFFANQPGGNSSDVDLFGGPDPIPATAASAPMSLQSPTNSKNADLCMKISLDDIEESDSFGAFTSHVDAGQPGYSEDLAIDDNIVTASSQGTSAEPPKKAALHIKSGIWADSLSRGLIDLNITAPKANLADIGIVGDLEDASGDKGKGKLAPSGLSLDWPGFDPLSASSTTGNLCQEQPAFAAFK